MTLLYFNKHVNFGVYIVLLYYTAFLRATCAKGKPFFSHFVTAYFKIMPS